MIEVLPESSDDVIGFAFDGRMTRDEYNNVLLPPLDRAVREHGNARILFQIVNFRGWMPHGAWEDLKNWPHITRVDRIAVVGGERWQEWMNRLPGLFVGFIRTDVRYFPETRLDDAWTWLRREAGGR
ncbi:STAS/SEC14 domain-containing protein [Methanoculleus sp. FWC-SCC1]|uniref:STAS/SEC14 domain-containing protein n=1 Tax=Methanoculleus frigidifontis TaxID=2584085 RepID=A0ABT8MAH3_9EURY|nr:STAS/SEC14 domain-containing protein [Methanoculleus sp. FWC-SCC1]MDN7024938.1 STAS/SEC14 domain-containing protein [Methanoculleus sp. FWC-SCC1]